MIIPEALLERIERIEQELEPRFHDIARIAFQNQNKVLNAFQNARIGSHHFQTTSGYGYHDPGREALEQVFATVFKAEAALVRQQLVSGTHAIACAILGNLGPGDELLIASGPPYETLFGVLGIPEDCVSAVSTSSVVSTTGAFTVRIVPLSSDCSLDLSAICRAITSRTRLVAFQRSCGYSERHSFSIAELQQAFQAVKTNHPELSIFVDNCYGEFVAGEEPLEVGADLLAGSLIKNPGGCLVPSGGYIVGRTDLVEHAAERLYAPKIGGAIGPSLINPQLFFQGFFEAPHRVGEMLKGALLTAALFEAAGFRVAPQVYEPRGDVIQKIYFKSAPDLIRFCRAIQETSPIESDVIPEPAPMPGYQHHVIMGGGTFISGATSEFSADAPIAPPYIAFLQGGLSYTQIKVSIARIFTRYYWSPTSLE